MSIKDQSITVYKFVNPNMTTYRGYQWVIGQPRITSGEGELCGEGWLHAYTHPLLAELLNPIHGNYSDEALIYRGKAEGPCKTDRGLKVGYTRMTLTHELQRQKPTTEKAVRFGLACAVQVGQDRSYRLWAEEWIQGIGRTPRAAWATWATWAAQAEQVATRALRAAAHAARAAQAATRVAKEPINLIALAEWAYSDEDTLPILP